MPPLKGEVAFHHVSDEMTEGSAVEEPSWNFLYTGTRVFHKYAVSGQEIVKCLLNFTKGVVKVMFMLHDLASNQARHNCVLFAAGYCIILSLLYGIIASHRLCIVFRMGVKL